MALTNEGAFHIIRIWAILVIIGITHGQSSEYIITHSPKYITFAHDAGKIKTNDIPSILAAAFGIPLKQDVEWDGLHASSVFHRPKASVLVSVEGHKMPLGVKSTARFPITLEDDFVDMEQLSYKIQSSSNIQPLIVDFSVDNTIFDVKSEYPQLFKHLPATYRKVKESFMNGEAFKPSELGSLNYTLDNDLRYLGELFIIKQIIRSVKDNPAKTKGSTPDLFNFKVTGLSKLADEYGIDSSKYSDAVILLEKLVEEMTLEFKEIYKNNVIVQVISLPKPSHTMHSRHIRSLKQETSDQATSRVDKEKSINYADDYYDLFPVTFNIVLWTSIILGISILLISWALWTMDPGRDSIIYRMTSQRMKKE